MDDLVPIRFLEENVLIGKDLIPICRQDGGRFIGDEGIRGNEGFQEFGSARQIMDNLIPMSRMDGGVLIGKVRPTGIYAVGDTNLDVGFRFKK